MASVIVCSSPLVGHVTPMLAVAAGLVERGHDVRFLTGRRFEPQVARTGATFVPLPPEADFDDSRLDEAFPGRVGLKGPKGIRFDIQKSSCGRGGPSTRHCWRPARNAPPMPFWPSHSSWAQR